MPRCMASRGRRATPYVPFGVLRNLPQCANAGIELLMHARDVVIGIAVHTAIMQTASVYAHV